MSRIARSDIYAALDRAAQNIKAADTNGDGRISRAEAQAKVASLSGTEQQLTDMFYRFADKRDAAAYAKLTRSDVDRTLAYAKKELVSDYDVNNNGLSADEVAKMSRTGKLAVQLAQELKAARGAAASGTSSFTAQQSPATQQQVRAK